ncbi:hypothetical protein [Hyphobacterium sp.]|uniref:hypothetical protein n=1 Tax=Hyphobacterium sp. TaxID=2004662 RepID=UPI003749A3C1
MRYQYIRTNQLDPRVRWVHFADRRPWIDRLDPQVTLEVMIVGEDVSAMTPEWLDREGRPLAYEIDPAPVPPDGLHWFAGQPPEKRILLGGRLAMTGPGIVRLVDTATGTVLLTLEPETLYPQSIFALLEELRISFAPAGFDDFVETGTLFGHTTLHASNWFKRVTTIELSRALYENACKDLSHRPNIRCLQGNSGDVLPAIVSDLPGTSFFFLDAHWSGSAGVDWKNSRFSGYPVATARLDTETDLEEWERQIPLLKELRAIANGHAGRAAVLIDDWGGIGKKDFGFSGEDWTGINREKLLDWFSDHPRTLFLNPVNDKQYLWAIEAKSGTPKDAKVP